MTDEHEDQGEAVDEQRVAPCGCDGAQLCEQHQQAARLPWRRPRVRQAKKAPR